MKARHIALYFTEGIKNKKESLIITATVVVCVYIESAENTPNMDIKIFFFFGILLSNGGTKNSTKFFI